MSKRQVVGSVPSSVLGMLGDLCGKIRSGVITAEQLGIFLKKKNPFEEIKAKAKNWLQAIVDQEREFHRVFFGCTFLMAEFTKTLKKYGPEKIEAWKKFDLEPHFFPPIFLSQNSTLPGWKIKSENWFWEKIREAKLFRIIRGEWTQDQKAGDLEGITVLVDTRLKPKHGNEYKDDWLGQVITKLRKTEKIQDFNPRSSRFGVSAEEIELIKFEAAQILGLKPEQLRLEREIEANVIPQMYPHMPRKDDGKTNTWEWREEFFLSRGNRLYGGNAGGGGLAHVNYALVSDRWVSKAFRFLVVL